MFVGVTDGLADALDNAGRYEAVISDVVRSHREDSATDLTWHIMAGYAKSVRSAGRL